MKPGTAIFHFLSVWFVLFYLGWRINHLPVHSYPCANMIAVMTPSGAATSVCVP